MTPAGPVGGPPDDAELEDLYDRAPCGLLSTRMDGTITRVNTTLLDLLGRRRDELVGCRFVDLLSVGDRIYHETHYAPLLAMQGAVGGIAVDLRGGDGRLPVLLSSAVTHDGAGRPVGIRTAVFEAVRRRGYERELLRAREAADRERDNARRLARELQRSLLPPTLPAVPGVELAAHYHPGSDDEVGGDFYDVFPLADGGWAFFLGDVCGKGATAAALTSLARYALRSAAVHDPDPTTVLTTLNTVLRQECQPGVNALCTTIFGLLTPSADGARIVMGTAGHPAPLLLPRAGGARYLDVAGGQLLGALDSPTVAVTTVDLAPGDAVLLHTDGLTEARTRTGRDDRYEEERLLAFAHDVDRGAAATVISALTRLLADLGDGVEDDVALLALRAAPSGSP